MPTDAEIEAAEREYEYADRMARTFIEIFRTSPQLQKIVAEQTARLKAKSAHEPTLGKRVQA